MLRNAIRIASVNRSSLFFVLACIAFLVSSPGWTIAVRAEDADKPVENRSISMGPVKVGDLEIAGAWLRPTPSGAPVSAGYLIIRNRGSQADRLVGASADFAARTEIHEMALDGGVMKMRPVSGSLEVPPGGEAILGPGGMHIMFMGMKDQLVAGQTRKILLRFEKAGDIELMVPITATPVHQGN